MSQRLAAKLKQIRETLGHTCVVMARRLDVTEKDIERYESDEFLVDVPTLHRYAQLGYVRWEDLTNDEVDIVPGSRANLFAICPDCEASVRLTDDTDRGEIVDCHECKQEWQVASLDPPELDVIDFLEDYDDDDDDDEDEDEFEKFWGLPLLVMKKRLEAFGYKFVESADLPPVLSDWCVGDEVLCLVAGSFTLFNRKCWQDVKPFPIERVSRGYRILEGLVVLEP